MVEKQSFTLENLCCTMKENHGRCNGIIRQSWGTEVCERIGIFMFSLIGNTYNRNNIGLCRDYGLAVFRNTSNPQSEKIKKTSQKMFKIKGLDIIINCNMKIVNYVGVTLKLNDGSYCPYITPNEETNYIHVNSDHPPLPHLPSILRQVPISVENGYHLYHHLKIFSKKLCYTMNSTSETVDTKKRWISCNDKNYKPKLYKGSCETSFKKRYSNHKKSFNVPLYKHDTKLSTEYWNLKMKQLNPQISWKIKGIYKSYNLTSKRCSLWTRTCSIKDQKSSPSVVTGIIIDLKH